VGGKVSDFQALVAPAGTDCDPLNLLRACGLKAWHFSNLVSGQNNFQRFVWREFDAPFIDLTNGFEGYLARKENGRRLMAEFNKKMKKLIRDVGPLRYEVHTTDSNVFRTLLDWKSDQYRRTNLPNIFDFPWVRKLLLKISEYDSEDFSPMMSALYAGDKLAAMILAMRSRAVLHSWFPAYNVELSEYSPGLLHWIETMRAADSLGIRRIDLGAGGERYKGRLMSGSVRLGEGTVDLQPAAALARQAWRTTRERVRASMWAKPARFPARLMRHFRHWLDVRSPVSDRNV
jgi:CelD/BcsL family acetyltransferase involved in cellulose biosynthesis